MKMILLHFICPLITLNILAVLGPLVTLSACFLRFPCPKSIFIYLSFLLVEITITVTFSVLQEMMYSTMMKWSHAVSH